VLLLNYALEQFEDLKPNEQFGIDMSYRLTSLRHVKLSNSMVQCHVTLA